MRTSIGLLLFLFVSACAPDPKFGVSWSELGGVPLTPADTVTTYGTHPSQFGEWRFPDRKGPYPVVMLIHGGCWLNAFDLRYMGHLAEALTDQGFATYNVEFRRLGDEGGGRPGTLDDILSAFRSMSAHENAFRLDLSDITVTGHSAGGHLALWLASETDSIRSVVGLAAITDIALYAQGEGSCNQGAKRFLGDADPAPVNPTQRPSPAATVHLLSGHEDLLVPASYGTLYASKMNARHTILQQAGHFDLVAPQSGAWKTVLKAFN
jgi:acetyl esterase/lipase